MRFLLKATMLLLLSCLPLEAQDQAALEAPDQTSTDVGGGVICDTQQQVERFAALRGDGTDAAGALQRVNREAHDPDACNFTFVQFSRTKPIAGVIVEGRPASILEITVHAFGNGRVWKQIPPMIQYTVAIDKGRVS